MQRVATSAVLLALFGTSSAHAQDYAEPPPAPPPQGYVAPLSQTYQGTYVPQSVALSGPEEIEPDRDNQRAPDGYTAVQRTRKGALIGGLSTLGASYSISLLMAAEGHDSASYCYDYYYDHCGGTNEYAAMWIPVAGPFIQMGDTDSATERVFLAGLGAAQLTGAILLYRGLTSKKTVFVRNDVVGSLQFAPMAPSNANGQATGMLVGGRF